MLKSDAKLQQCYAVYLRTADTRIRHPFGAGPHRSHNAQPPATLSSVNFEKLSKPYFLINPDYEGCLGDFSIDNCSYGCDGDIVVLEQITTKLATTQVFFVILQSN